MRDLIEKIVDARERIRNEQPLVHAITNFVTMNDVANGLLALGARPVMAHALDEVDEITRDARVLVLNLGTPSRERVNAMLRAARAANDANIPIIFDPVGVGASKFRSRAANRILGAINTSIVRGNADEIAFLAGIVPKQLGIDGRHANFDRAATAKTVAKKFDTVAALTGAADFVSDGARLMRIENGHAWLQKISGAGDIASALMGAFMAVENDALIAAASALVVFDVAAECAAENAHGVGSFHARLFDALENINSTMIKQRAKIELSEGG